MGKNKKRGKNKGQNRQSIFSVRSAQIQRKRAEEVPIKILADQVEVEKGVMADYLDFVRSKTGTLWQKENELARSVIDTSRVPTSEEHLFNVGVKYRELTDLLTDNSDKVAIAHQLHQLSLSENELERMLNAAGHPAKVSGGAITRQFQTMISLGMHGPRRLLAYAGDSHEVMVKIATAINLLGKPVGTIYFQDYLAEIRHAHRTSRSLADLDHLVGFMADPTVVHVLGETMRGFLPTYKRLADLPSVDGAMSYINQKTTAPNVRSRMIYGEINFLERAQRSGATLQKSYKLFDTSVPGLGIEGIGALTMFALDQGEIIERYADLLSTFRIKGIRSFLLDTHGQRTEHGEYDRAGDFVDDLLANDRKDAAIELMRNTDWVGDSNLGLIQSICFENPSAGLLMQDYFSYQGSGEHEKALTTLALADTAKDTKAIKHYRGQIRQARAEELVGILGDNVLKRLDKVGATQVVEEKPLVRKAATDWIDKIVGTYDNPAMVVNAYAHLKRRGLEWSFRRVNETHPGLVEDFAEIVTGLSGSGMLNALLRDRDVFDGYMKGLFEGVYGVDTLISINESGGNTYAKLRGLVMEDLGRESVAPVTQVAGNESLNHDKYGRLVVAGGRYKGEDKKGKIQRDVPIEVLFWDVHNAKDQNPDNLRPKDLVLYEVSSISHNRWGKLVERCRADETIAHGFTTRGTVVRNYEAAVRSPKFSPIGS